MNGLLDRIIEGRIRFAHGLEATARQLLTGDIDLDFQQLVEKPLENPKKSQYFKERYKIVGSKPITWESLKNLKDVAGSSTVDHSSITGSLQQVSACVDGCYTQLLEGMASLPMFYMQPSTGIEPNCVGAAQIISSLYSFDKPIQNLDFLTIMSTKRRDNVLAFLRNLDGLPNERIGHQEMVELNVDSFSGYFPKEEARDKLLDAALLLEETGHVAVREKQGEVFDFDMEKNNFKRYETCSVKEGIWASAVCNIIGLYRHLGLNARDEWRKISGKIKAMNRGIASMTDYSLGLGSFNELQNVFGEDIPARYYMAEMATRRFDLMFNYEAREHIEKTYPHPSAFRLIGKKYLSEEDYMILIDSTTEQTSQSPLRRIR